MKYHVSVDDNFHFLDTSERDAAGSYDTAEKALKAAQNIVDKSLKHLYKSGYTAEKLFSDYMDFGDDPFIVSDDTSCKFSAWSYAESRCPSICTQMSKNKIL